jgi:hypothetical protein
MVDVEETSPSSVVDASRRVWAIAAAGMLFVAGVHLDGWAHNHERVDDSFFTPWHAVMYAGYVVLAVMLARPVLARRAAGASWAGATERWERLALVGIVVFFAGAVGDMAWHMAFGIEETLEALLSPTHLTLALGGTFMGTAAYLGSAPGGTWRRSGPAVLAGALIWSILGFLTQYMHPLVELWPAPDWAIEGELADLGRALGVAGILLHSVIGVAVVLVLLAADRLPAGAVAVVVGITAALAVTQGDSYWLAVPVAIAGTAVEAVRRRLRVAAVPGWRVRVFSFAMPAILTGATMASLAVGPGVAWSFELWAGSIAGGGLLGALVSTIVVPARTA